jgi:hypothetical protein
MTPHSFPYSKAPGCVFRRRVVRTSFLGSHLSPAPSHADRPGWAYRHLACALAQILTSHRLLARLQLISHGGKEAQAQ